MLKIVFSIMTLTTQGPVKGDIAERPVFQDEATCIAYGEKMLPRVEDWVRGATGMEWDHPVIVTFQCVPNGQGA